MLVIRKEHFQESRAFLIHTVNLTLVLYDIVLTDLALRQLLERVDGVVFAEGHYMEVR